MVIVGTLFFLAPMALLVLYLSWPIFVNSFLTHEQSSNAGGLTVWPVRLLVPVGFALLILQAIIRDGAAQIVQNLGVGLDGFHPLQARGWGIGRQRRQDLRVGHDLIQMIDHPEDVHDPVVHVQGDLPDVRLAPARHRAKDAAVKFERRRHRLFKLWGAELGRAEMLVKKRARHLGQQLFVVYTRPYKCGLTG